MRLRHLCHENHTGPPSNVKIGNIAGWEVFGEFVAEGGYGVDQSVLDDIASLNEAYQDDEYLPRQAEAAALHAWFDTTQEVDGAWETDRAAKVARLAEINAEIDMEWCAVADAAYELVGDAAYDAFLDAHDL
jgi:hypothetical protein